MSHIIAPATTPTVMRKPNPNRTIPQPTVPTVPTIPTIARTPIKPPMPSPIVMASASAGNNSLPKAPTPQAIPSQNTQNLSHFAAPTTIPTLPTPVVATQIPPDTPSAASTLSVLSQIVSDQIRIQMSALQKALEAKIESSVRDVVGTAVRDLKNSFDCSEIKGETLNANLPLLAKPDPDAKVEYTFEQVGTIIPLFCPFMPNVFGVWAETRLVTSNGSVVKGWVPIFTKKFKSVLYPEMTPQEWESRVNKWSPYLKNLADRDLVPHVARFQ